MESNEFGGCKRCGVKYNHWKLHCIKCVNDLLKNGICAHCGVEPRLPKTRGPQSKYCFNCRAKIEGKTKAIRGDKSPAKFRDKDSKENRYETKHGG